jgi:hypothetical protein
MNGGRDTLSLSDLHLSDLGSEQHRSTQKRSEQKMPSLSELNKKAKNSMERMSAELTGGSDDREKVLAIINYHTALPQEGGKKKVTKKKTGKRRINGYSLSNSFDVSNPNQFYSDEDMSRRPPPDPAADAMYKSFLETIMDTMGVDEKTARIYRAAIKRYIGVQHPELRPFDKDALKVKEMESIVNDKKKLKEFVETQSDLIASSKKFMEEHYDENKKRTESQKKPENSTEDSTEEKPKKTKGKKKVADSGYLLSDNDRIFSTED